MKKLMLAFLVFSSFSYNTVAQEVSVSYGYSDKANFLIGLNVKNIYNGIGLYCNSYGSGTAYTTEGGVDYSSICDYTAITDLGIVKNNYGMSFGITYNPSILVKEDFAVSIHLGSGFSIEEDVSSVRYYYMWYDFPSLNEGRTKVYVSRERTRVLGEILISYDILHPFKSIPISLGVQTGYNTSYGYIAQGFLGINLYKKRRAYLD